MNTSEEIRGFQKKELTPMDVNEFYVTRRQIVEQNRKKDVMDKRKTLQLESMLESSKKETEIKNNEIEQKNTEIMELKQQLRQSNQDKEKIVSKLISLIDQFDNVYEFSLETGNNNLQQNMKGVMKIIDSTFREIGITEVPAQNEKFNENYHNCVETIEDSTQKKNEIVKVYEKGYLYNGKIIRYATVATVK